MQTERDRARYYRRLKADVGAVSTKRSAAVHDREQEPAGELSEVTIRAQALVEPGNNVVSAHQRAPVPPGDGAREDIAHPVVQRRGHQPSLLQAPSAGIAGSGSQPTELDARARRELDHPAAERRHVANSVKRSRGETSSREPHPHQPSIGRLVHAQHARTVVGIQGAADRTRAIRHQRSDAGTVLQVSELAQARLAAKGRAATWIHQEPPGKNAFP